MLFYQDSICHTVINCGYWIERRIYTLIGLHQLHVKLDLICNTCEQSHINNILQCWEYKIQWNEEWPINSSPAILKPVFHNIGINTNSWRSVIITLRNPQTFFQRFKLCFRHQHQSILQIRLCTWVTDNHITNPHRYWFKQLQHVEWHNIRVDGSSKISLELTCNTQSSNVDNRISLF